MAILAGGVAAGLRLAGCCIRHGVLLCFVLPWSLLGWKECFSDAIVVGVHRASILCWMLYSLSLLGRRQSLTSTVTARLTMRNISSASDTINLRYTSLCIVVVWGGAPASAMMRNKHQDSFGISKQA